MLLRSQIAVGKKRVPSSVGFAYQGVETTSMGQVFKLPIQGMIRVLHNKVYLLAVLVVAVVLVVGGCGGGGGGGE